MDVVRHRPRLCPGRRSDNGRAPREGPGRQCSPPALRGSPQGSFELKQSYTSFQ